MMIVELMPVGDLKNYLKSRRYLLLVVHSTHFMCQICYVVCQE